MNYETTTYMDAARDLVNTGMRAANTALSEGLEFCLSKALARGMSEPVETDLIATRMAHLSAAKNSQTEMVRLAEDCLLACGLFRARLDRLGGPDYYIRVGRTAYDHAGMIEPAYGFGHMVDVLIHVSGRPSISQLVNLARQNSSAAEKSLKDAGVLIFRRV